MRVRVFCLLVAARATVGCAKPPEPPPSRLAPVTSPAASRPPPPAWTYYEPIDVTVRANVHGPDLPLEELQITLLDDARARWASLPEATRDRVRRQGFAVVTRGAKRSKLGEYYADLRAAKVPYIVTLDALVVLSHIALDRALAEAEERTLVPSLDALLKRLEARLGAERRGAAGDLAPAYDLARGIVAVARALMSPAYEAPADIAALVNEEAKRARAHAGRSHSPLLGVSIDYSALMPRGAADKSDARAAYFRAMAWLTHVPMMLVARGEVAGAVVPLGKVRAHVRAALLVARLLEPEVDAEAASAWGRVSRVSELVGGASDDASPRDLAKLATALGIDVKDVAAIADVTKVDRLRHARLERASPRLYDGNGGARATAGASSELLARASASARFFPPRGTPDAEVLGALVFPGVGKIASESDPQPATAERGLRAMPTGLDVAAWLGAADARALLHEAGDDAYEGYDAAMQQLYARRPPEERRHDSIIVTALDAFATILAPSASDPAQPCTTTSQWRRRKLEVALGAWTMLRHDTLPFARFPLGPLPEALPRAPHETRVSAFVEPHPEAIAKLAALVRQIVRGLWAVAELPEDCPSRALLAQVDALFATALAVAQREANDEPLAPHEKAALDELPSRLLALDAALTASRAPDVSLAVDVHVDAASARVLEEATGDLEDLYVVLREPRSGRLVLAVGASLPHYEFTQPTSSRLSDDGWRARLHAASPPERDAFTRGYVSAGEGP